MDPKKKPQINNVKNRFLFIAPSVEAGLEPEAKIDDFKITQELGEGSFGRVLKVTHRATGRIYAIKAIDKRNKTNQQGKPYFRREIEIMYKVHHPNAVRLYTHFEDDIYCYFVMELVSKGNLYELLQKLKTTMNQSTIIHYMRDLISAVYYLHNMEPAIVHRDIKPENVLIAENNSIKLTDFGWSNYIVDDGSTRSTYCGTPLYLAPEMIKEIGHDEFLDIWCLGILMFELITGSLPFTGKNVENLSGNILKNKIVWPNDIGPDEKDLLTKILKTNPSERLSLKGILAHPYFTKIKVHDSFVFFTPKEGYSEEHNNIFLISTGLINPPKVVETRKEKQSDSNLNISGFNNAKEETPNANSPSSRTSNEIDHLKKECALYKNKVEKYEGIIKDLEKGYLDEKNRAKTLTNANEEFQTQVKVLLKNKASLITDLEETEGAKIASMRVISDLNAKLLEKDNKNKTMTKAYVSMQDKNKHNDEELKRLEKMVEENDENMEKLKSENLEQVSELQKNLLEALEKNEEKLDTRCTLIRDSISEMATINPTNKYTFGSDSNNDGSELKKKIELEYEEKINKIKDQFSVEMKTLQSEIGKEREKFNKLLRERENDIKKLLDDRKTVKETVAKSYEKSLTKSELVLKIKESEIEKLNAQIKKLDKLLELNGIMKKK